MEPNHLFRQANRFVKCDLFTFINQKNVFLEDDWDDKRDQSKVFYGFKTEFL